VEGAEAGGGGEGGTKFLNPSAGDSVIELAEWLSNLEDAVVAREEMVAKREERIPSVEEAVFELGEPVLNVEEISPQRSGALMGF
jgi:hypothetical protein